MEQNSPQQYEVGGQNTAPARQNSSVIIAMAIVVAGLMISVTLIAKSFIESSRKVAVDTYGTPVEKVDIKPVTNKDHILGNPKAKVMVIEYSDTECPFCKQFHTTLQRLMTELGANGEVAWVYRHFPLYKGSEGSPALHSKAGKEAEATECASEVGGNEKFWAYLDRIYSVTPSNNGLNPASLYTIASDIGLDATKFKTCLDSGKYADMISDSYDNAILAGAQGTPYTVILNTRTSETIPMGSATIPYPTLKTVVQAVIAK